MTLTGCLPTAAKVCHWTWLWAGARKCTRGETGSSAASSYWLPAVRPQHLLLCCCAQRPLFALSEGLGGGGVVFAWSARGALLAAAGQPRAVLLLARDGSLVHRLELPAPDFAYATRLPCARQLQARAQLRACSHRNAQRALICLIGGACLPDSTGCRDPQTVMTARVSPLRARRHCHNQELGREPVTCKRSGTLRRSGWRSCRAARRSCWCTTPRRAL